VVLKKLMPGMAVYSVRKATGLSMFNGKWEWWLVRIVKVDIENERVFAHWNGNPPQWYGRKTWSKWRLKRPAT